MYRKVFDHLADKTADVWATPWWFFFCLSIVLSWLIQGAVFGLWTNNLWHLILNSPTTALTFLGVMLLHNVQHRGSKRNEEQQRRLEEYQTQETARERALLAHFGIADPFPGDPVQQVED